MKIAGLVVAALFAAGIARAATPTSPPEAEARGVISYPPEFFAEARPGTALDMIQRVPGFTVDSGAAVRGYAGAAGNVLIDGERPTTKTELLTDVLARIPASSVQRIDLIRGGAPGIEMLGRTVVANVIRRRGGELKRTVTPSAWIFGDGRVAPGLRLEANRQTDPEHGFELLLESVGIFSDLWGDARRVRRDPTGAVVQDIGLRIEGDGRSDTARGAFRRPLLGGLLQANAALGRTEFKDEQDILLPGRPDLVVGHADALEGEVGLDYGRELGPRTKLTLIALQRLTDERGDAVTTGAGGDSLSEETATSGESILRGRLAFARTPRVTLEGGAEGAFNFLEGSTRVVANGVEVPIPSANVRVEEVRGELFGQASWRPAETLSVDAGARMEHSTISQSGDIALERSFFYVKPRLAAAWTPREGLQLRLRFEREVGQLSFNDFVASASLVDDLVFAGNAQLEPQTAWISEAVLERRFWSKGVATATVRRRDLQNVIDFILVEGFEAPGNIGDGVGYDLGLSLTLPLDRLKVAGGLLRVNGFWRDSEVTDPLTGQLRRISAQRPHDATLGFSQDVERLKLTWGFDLNGGWQEVYYRRSEITEAELTHWYTAFIEYKPSPRWNLRAQITDLDAYLRRRTFFEGLRGSSPVRLVENRTVPPPFRLNVRLRRTLG